MSYAVVWLAAAEEQLAAAHMEARERGESSRFARIVSRLEQHLRTTPAEYGESRGQRSRVAITLPLIIQFEVFDDEQIVVVTDARHISGKS